MTLRHFVLSSSGDHRDLHSFPTRRSSDLVGDCCHRGGPSALLQPSQLEFKIVRGLPASIGIFGKTGFDHTLERSRGQRLRSEEHTSELQSRGHLVCRLLLEKKNKFEILAM